MAPLNPLVVVVGTTGVGKSKLAVELAEALRNHSLGSSSSSSSSRWRDGLVVNADAMQVYRGLDIITNKMPLDERLGVQHELMGFKEPGEQYVVGEWIRDALPIIDQTHRDDVLPIIAGGTLYWVQHLVFPDRLVSQPWDQSSSPLPSSPSPELATRLESLPPNLSRLYDSVSKPDETSTLINDHAWDLFQLLQHLDPDMAARWHWNDSRKVLRSLEIIKERGHLASVGVHSQDQTPALPRLPTLVFWLYARPEVLDPRLDARVDDMIKVGLLDELEEMRSIALSLPDSTAESSEGNDHTDSTTGIFQSIGYKEFAPLLANSKGALDISSPAFKEGVDRMKLSTRQYAKRQVKWIRNRLLPAFGAAQEAMRDQPEQQSRVYLLDASELGDKWEMNVKETAVDIMQAFLRGDNDALPDPTTLSSSAATLLTTKCTALPPSQTLFARRKRICEACTKDPDRPVMIEEGREWDAHVKTKVHKKLANAEKHQETIRIKREEARVRREQKAALGEVDAAAVSDASL